MKLTWIQEAVKGTGIIASVSFLGDKIVLVLKIGQKEKKIDINNIDFLDDSTILKQALLEDIDDLLREPVKRKRGPIIKREKTDERVVTYLDKNDYDKLLAICVDREEVESEIAREAIKSYFKDPKNQFILNNRLLS